MPVRAPRVIADNRRARFDYTIGQVLEAGIVLLGGEVKSLRLGQAAIREAHIMPGKDGLYLLNAHIPEYLCSNRFRHEVRRPRRLLMHKRQIDRLSGAVRREGAAIVPLRLYFNEKGLVKLELALATGRKLHDRRAAVREREWKREQGRLLRHGARTGGGTRDDG